MTDVANTGAAVAAMLETARALLVPELHIDTAWIGWYQFGWHCC